MRGDRLDVAHDCRFDLEFFRASVDTAQPADTGCNRCSNGVADTYAVLNKQHAKIKNA